MKKHRKHIRDIIRPEEVAHECFAVFIRKHKAARRLSKDDLLYKLKEQEAYIDFLKLCMEYDMSTNLNLFRKGLAVVVKAIGPIQVAKKSKINRITLYRMLKANGNPELKTFVQLMQSLGMGMWVVEKEFFRRREQIRRRAGKDAYSIDFINF